MVVVRRRGVVAVEEERRIHGGAMVEEVWRPRREIWLRRAARGPGRLQGPWGAVE